MLATESRFSQSVRSANLLDGFIELIAGFQLCSTRPVIYVGKSSSLKPITPDIAPENVNLKLIGTEEMLRVDPRRRLRDCV